MCILHMLLGSPGPAVQACFVMVLEHPLKVVWCNGMTHHARDVMRGHRFTSLLACDIMLRSILATQTRCQQNQLVMTRIS